LSDQNDTTQELDVIEEAENTDPASDSPSILDEKQIIVVNNIQSPLDHQEIFKNITLFGDIEESSASEIINNLLFLENLAKKRDTADEAEPLAEEDINFYLSTNGGSVSEMFSIIDIMQKVKNSTADICTYGIGKVMSAGVPILAAGTKGKRKIGKNCRIMLHSVRAGYMGNITSLENELEEIKWNQKRYIECLSDCSNLTKKKIKKMFESQKEVYISAEKAIKYGIVDEII
jgi:ATP-dependent Clp endopeptidase proteolytic subunit ClpP